MRGHRGFDGSGMPPRVGPSGDACGSESNMSRAVKFDGVEAVNNAQIGILML